MSRYILSIDAGTTGVTILLIDKNTNIVEKFYSEINQFYPKPGWVEHDPIELIDKIEKILISISSKYNLLDIVSIGITNQRETIVMWDKNSGEPIYNAIVWQCRRTKEYCNELNDNYKNIIYSKTGLYIDSYFSASKIKWLLENPTHTKKISNNKNLLVGTIDTWIIWNLSKRKSHVTDFTNASRTMLFNINTKKWDLELLNIFNIKKHILPEIKNSMDDFGNAIINNISIPINGVSGDQQSALFGHGCLETGTSKCTYGTGLFYLLNIGEKRIDSNNGLLTTLAINDKGKPIYAIEGSVFIGGAVIQWIRDELNLIDNASESEDIALSIDSTEGVYIVPAFLGLGAPHWDSDCRGIITGLTRGSNKKHIIRAALESIAYQVNDLLESIKKDFSIKSNVLNVDGGAANNNFLLQFQSDISNIKINKPSNVESTALGAGFLAGIKSGFWKNKENLFKKIKNDRTYKPKINNDRRNELINGWLQSIEIIKK